jgi:TPR repeat protein
MIKKWLVLVSLSIFLLTGLPTSSFSLAGYLTQVIETKNHTAQQLTYGISTSNEAALLHAWHKSKKYSLNWQVLAKKLANSKGDVAYLLAEFYLKTPPSSKQLSNQSEQAILWYQQAIRLNYPKATIALASLYFHQGNVFEAKKLLAKLQVMELSYNQHNDASVAGIILTIKIAISEGNRRLTELLLSKFSAMLQADTAGGMLLSTIAKYQVLPTVNKAGTSSRNNQVTCPNSIQIFATNLTHLAQAESLIKYFREQPLNDLVCFSPVRYLPLSTLSCSSAKQGAIICDESKLHGIAESVSTRYLAIMLPEGGANVHFGVLYFDAQDSVDVVEHEISHLLGFVDEYPLGKGHIKCRATQQQASALNIAVLPNSYQGERDSIRAIVLKQLAWAEQIKETTPILQLKDGGSFENQYWQLGTPAQYAHEVGLFRSKTCDNNSAKEQGSFNAFKPLFERTKMQYDELNFPKPYIALLHKNPQEFLMPSFHYNIALAYYQQSNIDEAKYWLKKAANWESITRRRKKVRQGNF